MIIPRRRHERGQAEPGCAVSHPTTSLAGFYDPEFLGGSHLRVLTEVWVAPGGGFPDHNHQNMEIISYVLAGHLLHRDGLGHSTVIYPGEVQHISAGSGIIHSEHNFSRDGPLHFLQIWIEPSGPGLPPTYAKRAFSATEKHNQLCLIASPDGRGDSLTLNQDVFFQSTLLGKNVSVHYTQGLKRVHYVYVAKGAMAINGHPLDAGDGAVVLREQEVFLHTDTAAEILLFDLPFC